MQDELKTTIRFSDFWNCFGAKGVVAMAWWMGAAHATEIRRQMGSFPIMQVSGSAGCGKTTLMNYLWKLHGVDGYEGINASRVTAAGLLRVMQQANERPVVLTEMPVMHGQLLTSAFSGDLPILGRQGHKEIKQLNRFGGALALCGEQSIKYAGVSGNQSLAERLIDISLGAPSQSEAAKLSVRNLHALALQDAAGFFQAVKGLSELIVDAVSTRTRIYADGFEEEHGRWISSRNAVNHGQIAALVYALNQLIDMPTEAICAAQAEVRAMAADSAMPH